MAEYFGISIDELVTGIAPENEDMHINTGLSNAAIDCLKEIQSQNITDNKVIIEFLNLIIENLKVSNYRVHMNSLSQQSFEYMKDNLLRIDASLKLITMDELFSKPICGVVSDNGTISPISEPISRNKHKVSDDNSILEYDNLDLLMFKISKAFERMIIYISKNTDIRRIYKACKIEQNNIYDIFDKLSEDSDRNEDNSTH